MVAHCPHMLPPIPWNHYHWDSRCYWASYGPQFQRSPSQLQSDCRMLSLFVHNPQTNASMPALELDDTEDEDSSSMPELESETDSSEPEDLVVHVANFNHTLSSPHGHGCVFAHCPRMLPLSLEPQPLGIQMLSSHGLVGLWLHIAHTCSPIPWNHDHWDSRCFRAVHVACTPPLWALFVL